MTTITNSLTGNCIHTAVKGCALEVLIETIFFRIEINECVGRQRCAHMFFSFLELEGA